MKPSLTIFCSASERLAPVFYEEAYLLTSSIVKQGVNIIYGGASVGVMGQVAKATKEFGGRLTGIIPESLNLPHIIFKDLDQTEVVPELMDRKKRLLALGDAALIFPGGLGTIDEASEALALKALGLYTKPIYFYNFMDFWDPLLDYFTELGQMGMIHNPLGELYQVFDSVPELVDCVKSHLKI